MSYGFNEDKSKAVPSIEDKISNAITSALSNILNSVYPVGSIYYSTNTSNPGTLFGGTWERYGAGRVLVGYDSTQATFSPVGKTGGNYSNAYTPSGSVGNHTLTINELPNHTHWERIKPVSATWGSGSSSGFLMTSDESSEYYTGGVRGASSLGNSHNHGFTGNAMNVTTIQPYQVVNIWRRIS